MRDLGKKMGRPMNGESLAISQSVSLRVNLVMEVKGKLAGSGVTLSGLVGRLLEEWLVLVAEDERRAERQVRNG